MDDDLMCEWCGGRVKVSGIMEPKGLRRVIVHRECEYCFTWDRMVRPERLRRRLDVSEYGLSKKLGSKHTWGGRILKSVWAKHYSGPAEYFRLWGGFFRIATLYHITRPVVGRAPVGKSVPDALDWRPMWTGGFVF